MLCDRVQEFKSSVAAVVEGSLYHHHRVIGFMVIGFMVFTQRFRDSFLGDARLRFRGILRFILHLLRVKPLTSYKSSCSSSSHTINYSESCHSLQRVMPLTTASHATNYSKSSRSSSASHSIIYIESYHSSSACQSIHPLQVIHHLQDTSLSLLEGLLDAFLGQEQVMHRVSTPFSRYKTSLQFQIQLPVFVSFLSIFIKTRAIRDQVTSNEL